MSNMAESLCLCGDPAFVPAPGVALHPVESEVIEDHYEGFPKWSSSPLKHSAAGGAAEGEERAGPSTGWGAPRVSFGATSDDQMSIAASEGELSLSGDDDPAALPPSGVVIL